HSPPAAAIHLHLRPEPWAADRDRGRESGRRPGGRGGRRGVRRRHVRVRAGAPGEGATAAHPGASRDEGVAESEASGGRAGRRAGCERSVVGLTLPREGHKGPSPLGRGASEGSAPTGRRQLPGAERLPFSETLGQSQDYWTSRASRLIFTLPLNAWETGHPSFASSASFWKAAPSSPC